MPLTNHATGFLVQNAHVVNKWRELESQDLVAKFMEDRVDFGVNGVDINTLAVVTASRSIRALLFQSFAEAANRQSTVSTAVSSYFLMRS